MTLRLPTGIVTDPQEAAHSTLEHELLAETAAALGRTGRKVEAALADHATADPDDRPARADAAADALYAFLVQRELCGLYDRERILADYAVPGDVVARLGARRN